jgi:hypothetical protein
MDHAVAPLSIENCGTKVLHFRIGIPYTLIMSYQCYTTSESRPSYESTINIYTFKCDIFIIDRKPYMFRPILGHHQRFYIFATETHALYIFIVLST